MASARDVIPIVLAGLTGAIGGPQSARGIVTAAELSRQSRIDKEQNRRRDAADARADEQLKLSQEAADRAERELTLRESTAKVRMRATKKALRTARQAENHAKSYMANLKQSNRWEMLDEQDRLLANLLSSPDEMVRFSEHLDQKYGGQKAWEEASKGLRAGERVAWTSPEGVQHSMVNPVRTGKAGPTKDDVKFALRDAELSMGSALDKANAKLADAREALAVFQSPGAVQGHYGRVQGMFAAPPQQDDPEAKAEAEKAVREAEAEVMRVQQKIEHKKEQALHKLKLNEDQRAEILGYGGAEESQSGEPEAWELLKQQRAQNQ